MIKRVQLFLGPTMTRVFVAWFAITGLISLILNSMVSQYDWVQPVQSLIAIAFLVGVVIIVALRLSPGERGRWLAILLPSIVALFVGLVVAPQVGILLVGGAIGWVIAGVLLTRSKMPMEYREAVKLLRKNEYNKAAQVMERVIDIEPDEPNHYRFRAEIYRLAGKLKPAIRDYQKMTQIAPQSALAYNGLAEVYLQSAQYDLAVEAARKANTLAPDDWVTYYNLGMIEDRLKQSDAVIENLNKALALKVKDARHRLLMHLYLLRAYARLGRSEEAEAQLKLLKKHAGGLEEWQTILKSEQAETLREVLGADVDLALKLSTGEWTLADLMRGKTL